MSSVLRSPVVTTESLRKRNRSPSVNSLTGTSNDRRQGNQAKRSAASLVLSTAWSGRCSFSSRCACIAIPIFRVYSTLVEKPRVGSLRWAKVIPIRTRAGKNQCRARGLFRMDHYAHRRMQLGDLAIPREGCVRRWGAPCSDNNLEERWLRAYSGHKAARN